MLHVQVKEIQSLTHTVQFLKIYSLQRKTVVLVQACGSRFVEWYTSVYKHMHSYIIRMFACTSHFLFCLSLAL